MSRLFSEGKQMNDTPTLVQFKTGWERDGTSPDGLPYYRASILIRMDRPPYLSIERVADDSDMRDHPMPFQMFQKEQAARKQSYAEGYPLAMWPAVNEAEFKMLVDRDVTTVEQLAGLHRNAKGGGTSSMPAELVELAERAFNLIRLQKGAGKYEELLKERDGRIGALEEQVKDAAQTIAAQKTLIDQLRIRGTG
jgi:hypothetical protein